MCSSQSGCFCIESLAPVSQFVVHPDFKMLCTESTTFYTLHQSRPLMPLLPKTLLVQLFASLPQGHCLQHKLTTNVNILPLGGWQCSHCCPIAPTKTFNQCLPSVSRSAFLCYCGGEHLKPIRLPSTLHMPLCTHQLILQGLNL